MHTANLCRKPSLALPRPALEAGTMHADRDVRRIPNPGQELVFVHHALDGVSLVCSDEELAASRRRGSRSIGFSLLGWEGGYGHPSLLVGGDLRRHDCSAKKPQHCRGLLPSSVPLVLCRIFQSGGNKLLFDIIVLFRSTASFNHAVLEVREKVIEESSVIGGGGGRFFTGVRVQRDSSTRNAYSGTKGFFLFSPK